MPKEVKGTDETRDYDMLRGACLREVRVHALHIALLARACCAGRRALRSKVEEGKRRSIMHEEESVKEKSRGRREK